MLPARYLFQQAVNVLREEGPRALLIKGGRKARIGLLDLAWSAPLVWRWALRRSAARLRRRAVDDSALSDVLETAYKFEGVGLYRTVKPFQRRPELRKLCGRLDPNAVETVVEIGTARGGTLFVWSQYLEPETLVSIDVNNTAKKTTFFETFTPPETKFLRRSSYDLETVDAVRDHLDGSEIDLLFIDGDHRYDAVKQDFERYSDLVRRDGWICLDDIRQTYRPGIEVYRLWEELRSEYDTEEILQYEDQQAGGIGVVRP